jgi:hypothetical protein
MSLQGLYFFGGCPVVRRKAMHNFPEEKGLTKLSVLFKFEGLQANLFSEPLKGISFHDGLRNDLRDLGRPFSHRRFPDRPSSGTPEEEKDDQESQREFLKHALSSLGEMINGYPYR